MSDFETKEWGMSFQLALMHLPTWGAQECPEERWLEVKNGLEPYGFRWEDGQLLVPPQHLKTWTDGLNTEKA